MLLRRLPLRPSSVTTRPDPVTLMGTLAGKRIVLGVTGGIAAYKAVEVCRRLVDAGAHVQPVMTDGALKMVGATTFSALASETVRTSLFGDPESPIPHTQMGRPPISFSFVRRLLGSSPIFGPVAPPTF